MLIYYHTHTQSANFRGNPLCQATKQQFKSLKVMRNKMRSEITYLFW